MTLGLSDLKGAKVLSPTVERKHYCEACVAIYNTVEPSPHLTLALPAPILVPGIFGVEGTTIAFASELLVEQLDKQGFLAGLELVPSSIVNPTDYQYFGLLARTILQRAEPFGSASTTRPCAHCGAQSPAHEFFYTFEHLQTPEDGALDWYCERYMGPAYPMVTGRLYRWLKGKGAPYVGHHIDGKPMWAHRAGWYPEDAKTAYLPERFQGVSSTPIEPLRPDEYPLTKPAAKKRNVSRSR